MARALEVTFSDGKTYRIPLRLVQEDRAAYFAEQDSKHGADYQTVYQQEMTADNEDLLDWVWNNMEWADLKDQAKLINRKRGGTQPDYDKEWTNADMQVTGED